jgi:hypothetical protein
MIRRDKGETNPSGDEYASNPYSNAPRGYPTQVQDPVTGDWYGLFYPIGGDGKPAGEPMMYAPWGGPFTTFEQGRAAKAAAAQGPPPDIPPSQVVYHGSISPYSLVAVDWSFYQQNNLAPKNDEIFVGTLADVNAALSKFTVGDLATADISNYAGPLLPFA